MKPKILLSASLSPQPYIDMLIKAGADPVSIYCPDVDTAYDGLLLCGGPDVQPHLYGEEINGAEKMVPERDDAEIALIKAFIEAGKPIFGVCRGAQILNVYFGGTLHQDLANAAVHTPFVSEVYIPHPCTAIAGSVAEQLYGKEFIINSHHHQAVKDLGEGLRITATHGDVVEAFEHESLPVSAVQFHPERMIGSDTVSGLPIIGHFVQQCIDHMK